MLDQLAAQYGFTVYSLDADSPAGRRLRQVSGLQRLPGIYVDLELIASGRPEPEMLRQVIVLYLILPTEAKESTIAGYESPVGIFVGGNPNNVKVQE